MKKKIIITYGTFDLFHIGHLKLLKRIKELGDILIVAISTDEFNLLKGKKALIPYDQRAEIVQSIRYVDRVIPEDSWDQKIQDIKNLNIDLFVMGNDWEGKFDYLNEYCEVKYLNRTEGISSSSLKKTLGVFNSIDKEEILEAFDVLDRLQKDLEW